ncbi:MAG TPA: 50S ribosomal protein L3 N(5)-glutamine methyltransferase [Lamprocystis sp. (in: g-proteobacteria)]|nr:50S ribosomal protein L3 N(5)-glutamine methyltransferase [Lamprocystis sp. (in: g-proteobacteria)]
MAEQPDGLITIQDYIRWGASRFDRAGVFYGHGTDNALDEAAQLVSAALHLEPRLPVDFRECRLTTAERVLIAGLIERRITERVPAAYLTGRSWFAGLEFQVTEQVLVPRSPIAELIEAGFEPWADSERVERVLDLCAGSGCIGIAAALYLPAIEVDLVDCSPTALAVARRNLERHGVGNRVRAVESDLFDGLGGQRYDVICSNPPYVARAELAGLPPEYQREPRLGLYGGEDGLDLVVRILLRAGRHLTDHGILILEVGSAALTLERHLPLVPWTWIEFERGGEGVLVLTREQIGTYQHQFEDEARRRGLDVVSDDA